MALIFFATSKLAKLKCHALLAFSLALKIVAGGDWSLIFNRYYLVITAKGF